MNNHATVQSSTPVSAAPLLQVSGALIAIIALILAAAWLVKRLGFAPKRTGVNGLKISASASLGARERVVVVDVEDARLVLGVTAGQINLLHKLPPSAPTEEIPQTDFQSVMKICLSVVGDPDASFCCLSHLSFSGWLRPSPSRNCRVSPASRCLAVDKAGRSRCRRWCSSPR